MSIIKSIHCHGIFFCCTHFLQKESASLDVHDCAVTQPPSNECTASTNTTAASECPLPYYHSAKKKKGSQSNRMQDGNWKAGNANYTTTYKGQFEYSIRDKAWKFYLPTSELKYNIQLNLTLARSWKIYDEYRK